MKHVIDDMDGISVSIIGSVHEGGTVDKCPINIEDKRVTNEVINPITINLHIHINELPEGEKAKGFISNIIGGLYHAFNKPRHKAIENIEKFSEQDIQKCLVWENKS